MPAGTTDELTWREARRIVHEELNGLPHHLRAVLVLCEFQGHTQDQAAVELGLPKGTLRAHLERGREMLRLRLVRRGLGPAALLIACAWPATIALAGPAASLVLATTKAANDTAEVSANVNLLAAEAIKAMFFTRLKHVFAIALVFSVLGLGVYGIVVARMSATANENDQRRQPAQDGQEVWRERTTLKARPGPVMALTFSAGGKLLAAASSRFENRELIGEVTVYDTANWKELASIEGFWPMAFSPDDKVLATRSGSGFVKLWQVTGWKDRATLKALPDTVHKLAFGPDSKTLAVAAEDLSNPNRPGTIKIWNLAEQKELQAPVPGQSRIAAIRFPLGGRKLYAIISHGGATLTLLDEARNIDAVALDADRLQVMSAVFSPDGKYLAARLSVWGDAADLDRLKIWHVPTAKHQVTLRGFSQRLKTMVFSPDGKTLATGSSIARGDDGRTGEVRLWDVASGKELALLRGHDHEVWSLAFGPDGKTLASGSWDGTVKIWQLAKPAAPQERQDASHVPGD